MGKLMGGIKRIPLAVLIIVGGFFLFGVLVSAKPAPAPAEKGEQEAPRIDVVEANPKPHKMSVETQGTVTPRREIDLVAEISGKVVDVAPNFVNGGRFLQSDTLVQVDDREYQYQLVIAEANVAEAENLLATEKGRARRAKQEWRDLGNEEANTLFLRQPQLKAAKANLDAMQAREKNAQLNLERTHYKAPFTGQVKERFVASGQYVSPGTPLARIYDTGVVEVRLPVTDKDAQLLNLPLSSYEPSTNLPKVKIRGVIAGEKHEWLGDIVRLEAGVDESSRMHIAIAEVVNSPEKNPVPLLAGLYVEAEIEGRWINNVMELPRNAVFDIDKISLLDTENKLLEKRVNVLKADDSSIWVKGEVAEGELVLVEKQGMYSLGTVISPSSEKAESVQEEKTNSLAHVDVAGESTGDNDPALAKGSE